MGLSTNPTMTDLEILRDAVARSELTQRDFARDVLWRDARTLRRWLSGESPIPSVVADRLREALAAKEPQHNKHR